LSEVTELIPSQTSTLLLVGLSGCPPKNNSLGIWHLGFQSMTKQPFRMLKTWATEILPLSSDKEKEEFMLLLLIATLTWLVLETRTHTNSSSMGLKYRNGTSSISATPEKTEELMVTFNLMAEKNNSTSHKLTTTSSDTVSSMLQKINSILLTVAD
jgi:hypothetical protein